MQPVPGMSAADRGEDALHAGARIGRAAHHLDDAGRVSTLQTPQPVGIGVLPRLDDIGDA
jgi:hypothetical protein